MNSIIAWFAYNRVAANLLMVLILVSGLLALQNTKKTILPNLDLDIILITFPYPGASPIEVEEGVLWRVESILSSISGVETVEAYAYENKAVFFASLAYGYEPNDIKERIQTSVEFISGLPSLVERPIIQRLAIEREPVTSVVISGPADQLTLDTLAKKIKKDLVALPEITQVEAANERSPEIRIEVSELAMQRYGLSFNELAGAIKQQSVNFSAGYVESETGKTNVRTVGQAQNAVQYDELVIRTLPNGGRILLKDVASVVDTYKEPKVRYHFNGQPATFLYVYRTGQQNILKIAEATRDYINNPKVFLPESMSINISQDVSYYFKSRVDLLIENGSIGLAMLFFILMIFLRAKLSFWITLGIPVSFLGAFCVLYIFDQSFNMVSLFAFILVLGIVVDDAIIVGENIFSHIRCGNDGVEGAIAGAQEVAKPILFAVLTTMLMFAPLLYLPGPEGQLMRVVPIVVIAILAFSLIESLLILPAHLVSVKSVKVSKWNLFEQLQSVYSRALEYFIDVYFRPFIGVILRWRYPVTLLFMILFCLAMMLLNNNWLKVVLFSTIEADYSTASVSFPTGTPKVKMEAAVKRFETSAEQLRDQLIKQYGVDQLQGIITKYGVGSGASGDHVGSVVLEMTPSENRQLSGEQLNALWRNHVGDIPEASQVTFDSTLNSPGPAIDYELTGLDFDALYDVVNNLKSHLTQFDGVYGIKDSMARGSPELKLHLTPMAMDIGLQAADMANQVRQAFYGVDIQSIQRGQDEVNVVLRYPEDERKSLWYLENMQIRLPAGDSVPLSMVADLEHALGPAKIRHINQKRSIRVQAFVDESRNNARRITQALNKEFFPGLEQQYPNIEWQSGGVQKSSKNLMDYLFLSSTLALILMYILMAMLFSSYSQPLLVMFAIPFGFVGALLGHLIMEINITLWSAIGMAAVSGVVVNDNLVLVDYINKRRKMGYRLSRAIRDASAARFRPIILTSITTFFGLAPLMMETSVQAQFLVPMAVSLAYGVLFATLVSLLLVPASYYILEDIFRALPINQRSRPLEKSHGLQSDFKGAGRHRYLKER